VNLAALVDSSGNGNRGRLTFALSGLTFVPDGYRTSQGRFANSNSFTVSMASGANYYDTYTYDLEGNRLSKTHQTPSSIELTTSTYNADDELTQQTDNFTGTTTFGYDNNGSQLTSVNGSNVTTYTYDLRDRMVAVDANGTRTSYVYDDAGNRVGEIASGTTTFYLTDTANPTGYAEPIEQWTVAPGSRNSGTKPVASYIVGNRVLGQVTSSGVSYLIVDGHGSTRELVDATGEVAGDFNTTHSARR
jgi:YD repeat-containing protein